MWQAEKVVKTIHSKDSDNVLGGKLKKWQINIWILEWIVASRNNFDKVSLLKMEEKKKFVTKEASWLWSFFQWYFAKWEQEQRKWKLEIQLLQDAEVKGVQWMKSIKQRKLTVMTVEENRGWSA